MPSACAAAPCFLIASERGLCIDSCLGSILLVSGSGVGVDVVIVLESSSCAGFESFFDCGGKDGFVTLFELGPKARVCWLRVEVLEGLRRAGGILGMFVRLMSLLSKI